MAERLDDLTVFCDRQSAFISQRVMYEYVRARSGLFWDKLMREKAFVDGITEARWLGYGAVLDDLLIFLEGRLRPPAPGDRQTLCRGLMKLRAEVRQRHAALLEEPPGAKEAFARRLDENQLAAPATAETIAKTSGAAVYAALPLDRSVTKHDLELVTNAVRFLFARFASDLEKLLDLERARAVLMAE